MFRQTLSVIAVMSAISLMAACGSNDHNDQSSSSSSGGSNASSSSSSSSGGSTASSSSSSSGGTSSSSSSSSSSSGGVPVPVNSASCGTQTTQTPAADARTPQNLCVPALAYDEKSIVLAWDKADDYADAVDYNVYMDGKLLGSADANNKVPGHSPAKTYIDKFYATDTAKFHVRARVHNFTVDGLEPGSTHTFTVRAVFSDQSESADSNVVTQTTAALPSKLVSIVDKGAVMGASVDSATIKANTIAIQKAIDDCSASSISAYDCKVTVPAGVFVTGALFLKSNMTLEIQSGATIKGSGDWTDYAGEQGYYLYPVPNPVPDASTNYKVYRRPPSLLNVLPADNGRNAATREPGAFNNIRIVGSGAIDGNGWKRASTASITDEAGNTLPQYAATKTSSKPADDIDDNGILAAAQFRQAQKNQGTLTGTINVTLGSISDTDIYGQYRSSLVTVMGVKNIYFGGITALNPAFHGVMVIDSENVVLNALSHTTFDANNGDGIELGGVENAIVMNNFFDTGDDQVNFAAGQGVYGKQGRKVDHVWVFNSYFRRGHGGIAAGSNTAAGIQNVLAEDNVMYFNETGGLRMKSTSDTGGGAWNFTFRDTAMKCLKTSAFIFTLSYSQAPSGYVASDSAVFKNVTIKNVSADTIGTSSTGACKVPTASSSPFIDLEAGKYINSVAASLSGINFDNVALTNVAAARISGLKDSVFSRMAFSNVVNNGGNPWTWDQTKNAATLWGISDDVSGLTFPNTTPQP